MIKFFIAQKLQNIFTLKHTIIFYNEASGNLLSDFHWRGGGAQPSDPTYNQLLCFLQMNLSDMLDYMSKQDCDDLFSQLSDKTEDGGVVVYWNLFTDQYPSEKKQALQFQKDVSLELRKTDRSSIFYELCVLKKVA